MVAARRPLSRCDQACLRAGEVSRLVVIFLLVVGCRRSRLGRGDTPEHAGTEGAAFVVAYNEEEHV